MILPTVARLAVLMIGFSALVTLLNAGSARLTQPTLPRLLYSNKARLHLFETNCPGWLAVCANRDRLLLENLNQGFPVAQWSPDGAFIAVYTYDGWMIYRAECLLDGDDCQPTRLLPDANDVRIAWGPDGSAIAYRVEQSGAQSLHVRTRGCWDGSPIAHCIERTFLMPGNSLFQPDWSTDGHRVVFINPTYNLYLADMACLETGCTELHAISLVATSSQLKSWPSLSTDGSAILYAATPISTRPIQQLLLEDVETGQRRQLTFRSTDSGQPDWSADDRFVAYAGFPSPDDGNMDIYVLDLPRGLHVRLVRNPDRDMFPNWGPLPG
jgi:Tol biopolymer transport system component